MFDNDSNLNLFKSEFGQLMKLEIELKTIYVIGMNA